MGKLENASEPIGRTLGDFVIREKIGEGGFGAVYLAEQPLLGREAVIKLLQPKHRASGVITQRFLREARLASKLDHPYAAHIYAFGVEPDKLMWIAMEHVRGTPLHRLLRAEGPIPLDRFVPFLDRLCEVLHTAHEQGIVHRDIKPANVMVLQRAGRILPKLLDFGIAKLREPEVTEETERADEEDTEEEIGHVTAPEATAPGLMMSARSASETMSLGDGAVMDPARTPAAAALAPRDDLRAALTQDGAAVGSPSYMAPEQWLDAAAADARSDLYALGVLAFECLTGSVPYSGTDPMQIAAGHARKPVPPLGASFPPALDPVLGRALAKRPGERFPDVLAFAAAFRQASGVAGDAETLPRLPDELRKRVLVSAPQSIAEAVAFIAAARNAHQASSATVELTRAIVRYLGVLALACRSRGGGRDTPEVVDGLRALRKRPLADEEWLALARGLATADETRAIPELGAFLASREAELLLPAPPPTETSASGDDLIHAALERQLARAAALLRAVDFLNDYRLVAPTTPGRAEIWMGTRPVKRAICGVTRRDLAEGRPILVALDGAPVVSLWPLAQIAAPSPGAPVELFLFEGRGRGGGALLGAIPHGFERHDDGVWQWFREHLLPSVDESSPQLASETNPYRGLASFGRDDAALFFGREAQIEAFVNRLRGTPLLAVVGPSGAGKSSFVHAGVAPARPAARTITIRPGAAPVAALHARLAAEKIDPNELGHAEILLVVDQAEELFTLCRDPAERLRFAEILAGAARSAEDPLRVVLTLRDDFLARAAELGPLRERLGQAIELVHTPAPADLLRILVEPARRAGYAFEDADMPARMVNQVAGKPGALALLSFTAAELFRLRDRHFKQLSKRAYDEMGGVGGALAGHAEKTFAALTAEEQRLAREAFRHLVTAEGTRAVLTRAELRAILGGPAGNRTIDKLVDARLLVTTDAISDDGRPEVRVEIIHEALLSAWPRLHDWRAGDAEGTRLRDQVRTAARQWHERGRPRGLLWRDDALPALGFYAARDADALTDEERAFADASAREAARGRRRRRAAYLVALVLLAAGSVVLFTFARRAQDAAAEARRRLIDSQAEQGRQRFLAGDSMTALPYLAAAYRARPDDAGLKYMIARATSRLDLQRARLAHDGAVWTAAFDRDGARVVTASSDRTARIWDAATGRLLSTLAGHTDVTRSAIFSPDAELVATTSWDRTARLWNARTGEPVRVLRGHEGLVLGAAFSPDGTRLLTRSKDHTARVWDVATGAQLLSLAHQRAVSQIAWSHDGTRILTAEDGAAHVWDARDGRELLSESIEPVQPWAAAWGPGDETFLVSADANVRLFGTQDGRERTSLRHPGVVRSAAFDPSGARIATACEDGLGRIYDTSGKLLALLVGHAGAIRDVAFRDDGAAVVTASADGSVRTWNAATGRPIALYVGHSGPVEVAAFAPGSQALVSASNDGSARLWNATPDQLLWSQTAQDDMLDFRSDGALLAASADGNQGLIRRFDARTGAPAADLPNATLLGAATFSPDGRRLVARTDGGGVVLDASSGALLARIPGSTVALAFVGDGRRVLGARDAKVVVWDAQSGEVLQELAGHDGVILGVAASHDGTRVVSAARDRTARVWSLATGRELTIFRGHGAEVQDVQFSPDDEHVISGSWDRTAKIWQAGSGALDASLSGHTDSLIAVRWSPSGAVVATASLDRTARIWAAGSGELLQTIGWHPGPVAALAFSPDGAHLASAGGDRIAVWDVAPTSLTPAALDALVACRVPWEIVHGQLYPASPHCGP